jgi:lactoylglutathione lyase/glyoxylase I family protein
MIRGIAHICFTVSDMERSAAFYGQVLGLRRAFELNLDEGRLRGTYFHAGGRTFIELFAGDVGKGEGSCRHFCLEVDDIEQAVAGLRGRGAEVSDPAMGQDGSWQAWITDPDGNRIELHAYTADSLQVKALEG